MNRSEIFQHLKRRILRLGIAAIVGYLIVQFVAYPVRYSGQAMSPSYRDGSWLIVSPIVYQFSSPERFDPVAIQVGQGRFLHIARVVALPGESFEIRDSQVFVNGEALDGVKFELAGFQRIENYKSVSLTEHELFVVGDNHDLQLLELHSEGAFGRVQIDRIAGKVVGSF